jgi:alcohol dehydrogenase class IV
MLPHTMAAMRDRAPDQIGALANALGTDPADLEARIQGLGGVPRRLSELGAAEDCRDEAIDAMLARNELALTPRPPDRTELEEIVSAAF